MTMRFTSNSLQLSSLILAMSLVGFSTVPALAAKPKPAPPAKANAATEAAKSSLAPTGEKTLPIDLKKLSPQTQNEVEKLSATLHQEDKAISNELRDEQELSLKDIGMLWQAAVERSGTIRYAIEKLSRRDTLGKPVSNDSFTKRMVQSIARVGGMAGSVWTKNPAGFMGGSMINEMLSSDPSDPSNTRVTDADMLILAKEVEALQSQLIETYYSYCHRQEQWTLAQEASKSLKQSYQHLNESNAPEAVALQPIVESLYEGVSQQEATAKQDFISARNQLGLMVGSDALLALEQARQKEAHQATEETSKVQ